MNGPTREAIEGYYSTKAAEYESKYLFGRLTHIHGGHYDLGDWPMLRTNGLLLGLNDAIQLRRLMSIGQEQSISQLFSLLESVPSTSTRLMDCGAGHGGTSLWLAERYGCVVDSVTLSSKQAEIIASTARTINLDELVVPHVGDVRDGGYPSGPYDVIFGMDSFCQIGHFSEVFRGLRKVQPDGASLLLSDSFLSSEEPREAFNHHWVSDISKEYELFRALDEAGYSAIQIRDTTANQIPFWKLSINYTTALLREHGPDERLSASRDFHSFLVDSYQSGRMRYLQIHARAR